MKYAEFTKNIIYERQCGIYIITCDNASEDTGVYIGQSMDIHKRWLAHMNELKSNRHHNQHLQNVYNKYGENSLNFDILELCSQDKLNEREIFYINYFDSFKHGMNRTIGGDGTKGFKYTEEMRLARTGENSHWWGRKHEEGWYEKILPYILAVICKPVLQISKDTFEIIKEYPSISDAARDMKCSTQAISRCLNGQSKTSMGYIWIFKEDYKHGRKPQKVNYVKYKKVCQRDKDTLEIIKYYPTIEEAERVMNNNDGKRHHNIAACLSHRQKTAYGYIWTYQT
jgi:hypothetical protein